MCRKESVGLKDSHGPLIQIYANLSPCEGADDSTPEADIHMQLNPSNSFAILARCQSDTLSLATYNERLILDFKWAQAAALVHQPYITYAFGSVSFDIWCIIFRGTWLVWRVYFTTVAFLFTRTPTFKIPFFLTD